MTKVTAIITTKNRLQLLKNAISSIKNQTYKNIEIIVVDDGSTDGTENFMREISSRENLIYIRINPDESIGGNYARNLAIKKAGGEYIAFLDDDDKWLPKKIKKQVVLLDKNKNTGVVYTGIEYLINKKYKLKLYPNKEHHGDCSRKIFFNFIGITSNLMIRKELLNKIGGFDENLKFLQDYDLMIRLCQITQIDFIDECLIIYNMNQKDKSRITNKIKENKFEFNIEYFNIKFKEEIEKLTKEEKEKRNILFYKEYVTRYNTNKDYKKRNEYLYKIFKITHNIKDLIKYIFKIDLNKTFLIKGITKI